MYYVYALYNKLANKIYIGQTTDLVARLAQHNSKGFKSYTSRSKGAWEIIYSEKKGSSKEAREREKQLKSYQGRQFVKTHIPL